MKTLLKLLLFIILLALPFGVRYWLYFGTPNDTYQMPEMVTPDVETLSASPLAYETYEDQPMQGHGRILIDMAHRNNLLVDDLTPLLERLSARGISVSYFDYDSYYLSEELRSVTAFVVLAPTQPFYLDEILAVQDFVDQGGLLLLAADPTRSVPSYDSYGYVDLYSLFFPESAVPAVNSLANRFGIQFFEDYLYNLQDYQINYRNVKITQFASSPLTAGLDEMILFASHSLQSDGTALLTGDENTLSNVRTGESKLAAAALSANEQVLALGDLSLLTNPSHRAADNDHFLSNLADWLAKDARTWRLVDFPYLFTQNVNLISTSEDALSPAVLNLASPLQQVLGQADLTLTWSKTPTNGRDVLLAGLFEETQTISDVLASAGISITLVTDADDAAAADDGDEEESADDTDEESLPTEPLVSTVTVAGIGEFELEGLQLFLLDRSTLRTSLTILAADRDGLSLAVQRLLYRDFEGCATQESITLCAADAYAIWEDPEQPEENPSTPSGGGDDNSGGGGGSGSILLISVDSSSGAGRTSTEEWLIALDGFDVTVWSTSTGIPTLEDLAGYDAYIIDTGDYAYDPDVMDELPIFSLEGNWLLIGEQPIDPEYYTVAPLVDLMVGDANHQLAYRFPSDEPIVLSESFSGVPALVFPQYDEPVDGLFNVFVRGPSSEEPGSIVLQSYEMADVETHFSLATFAFYRLPEELRPVFANNVVAWLFER